MKLIFKTDDFKDLGLTPEQENLIARRANRKVQAFRNQAETVYWNGYEKTPEYHREAEIGDTHCGLVVEPDVLEPNQSIYDR